MDRNDQTPTLIAGEVRATCACCPSPAELIADTGLDALRRYCPNSHLTYLDRGDGLFEQDGGHLPLGAATDLAPGAPADPPALLSDRPAKTGPKTRISLERATFA